MHTWENCQLLPTEAAGSQVGGCPVPWWRRLGDASMENTTACLSSLLHLQEPRGSLALLCLFLLVCVGWSSAERLEMFVKSFESFQGKVKYLTQASVLIRGTWRVLLAAEPRCRWGDSGIIEMGNVWMRFFARHRDSVFLGQRTQLSTCSWFSTALEKPASPVS